MNTHLVWVSHPAAHCHPPSSPTLVAFVTILTEWAYLLATRQSSRDFLEQETRIRVWLGRGVACFYSKVVPGSPGAISNLSTWGRGSVNSRPPRATRPCIKPNNLKRKAKLYAREVSKYIQWQPPIDSSSRRRTESRLPSRLGPGLVPRQLVYKIRAAPEFLTTLSLSRPSLSHPALRHFICLWFAAGFWLTPHQEAHPHRKLHPRKKGSFLSC